jgi:Protein-L-isoaspartate(D-aspartate) O-methyltransferase (PCMT)
MDDTIPFSWLDARYGRIAVPDGDTGPIGTSLRLYGEWAEHEIRFLLNFIEPGCCVIDIGAYIGTHTLAFAKAVGPNGTVISIEAQDVIFRLLKTNTRNLSNVIAMNRVVRDGNKRRPIAKFNPRTDGNLSPRRLTRSQIQMGLK